MTIIVFPGQGSQYIGMAKDFYDNSAEARTVFDIIEKTTEINVKDIIFENKGELINITQYTQLCIFTASMAIFEVFKQHFDSDNINFVLGHSLGEYSALVASNVLSLTECSKLLKIRGELMQNAYPENKSGMVAILGLNCTEVEKIINENSLDMEVANDNAPGQVVISGTKESLKFSEKIFLENKAKKLVFLNVSSAFHSKIMKEAEFKMKKKLLEVTFNNAKYSLVSNYSALASKSKEVLLENLSKQMSNKVNWHESIKMLENKDKKIVEMGPGKVLSGLIKRISSSFEIYNFNKIEDIDNLKNVL